jgi:WD40 repeat protein
MTPMSSIPVRAYYVSSEPKSFLTSCHKEGMTFNSRYGINARALSSRLSPIKGALLTTRVLTIIVKQLFRFDAGVTCIQSHPNIEHLIAVGSYDATVRLFDFRKPLKPLSQADIGGGAWRVKWHPSSSRADDLLVAAMHDGFKIVRFSGIGSRSNLTASANGGDWEIIKRYDEHKSLAYGVDWSYKSSQDQTSETLIASASFYDHALHLWRG